MKHTYLWVNNILESNSMNSQHEAATKVKVADLQWFEVLVFELPVTNGGVSHTKPHHYNAMHPPCPL